MGLYKIIAFFHYDASASSEDGVYQGNFPKKRYRKKRRLPANNVLESTLSKLCITGLSSDHPKNYSIITYPDKGVFEGITRHGTSRRVGTMQYPNGDSYTGIFKRSKKSQLGELRYANGKRYIGHFKQDKCHGLGIIVYPNGSRRLGMWNEGVFTKGKRVYAIYGKVLYTRYSKSFRYRKASLDKRAAKLRRICTLLKRELALLKKQSQISLDDQGSIQVYKNVT